MTNPPGELGQNELGPYPYQIHERIDQNQGRMAALYRATITDGTGTHAVALKIASLRNRRGKLYTDALLNEVNNLRQLHHPHIVQLWPLKKNDSQELTFLAKTALPDQPLFAVLEYLPFGSLATLLKAQRRGLRLWMVLEIGYALASALDYLHARRLVHMDIKPENVLFRRPFTEKAAGEAVLIDFGSARTNGQNEQDTNTTFQESAYLAPEWIKAARRSYVTAHTSIDIYALGVTLYQCATGNLPFPTGDQVKLEAAITDGQVTERSNVAMRKSAPDQTRLVGLLDELIHTAMHVDPTRRPTSAQLAASLGEIRGQLRHPTRWNQVTAAGLPAQRARWWVGSLLFLGGLALGAGGTLAATALRTPIATVLPTVTVAPTETVTASPTLTATATATSTTLPTATVTTTPMPSPTASSSPLPTATMAPPTLRSTRAATSTPVSTVQPAG